jgi:hypothetical protein
MSDQLLEWISFRGSGALDVLPATDKGVTSRRALGNLSLLGHLELKDKAWRVAPPVLAALPIKDQQQAAAVLCGARTRGVLRRLNEASLSTGGVIEEIGQPAGPTLIRVTSCSHEALVDTAALAGIRFQADAAYTLLACVPSIGRWPRQACQMTGGKIEMVRRFSGSRAQWLPSSLSEAQSAAKGFFKIKRDWDWVSIIKLGPDDCAYIDDLAGRMLAAAKRRHAAWNSDTRAFSLPGYLFPPNLIARALVLCSGMLPEFDRSSGRICFMGVNAEMLRLTLSITGLRLA